MFNQTPSPPLKEEKRKKRGRDNHPTISMFRFILFIPKKKKEGGRKKKKRKGGQTATNPNQSGSAWRYSEKREKGGEREERKRVRMTPILSANLSISVLPNGKRGGEKGNSLLGP